MQLLLQLGLRMALAPVLLFSVLSAAATPGEDAGSSRTPSSPPAAATQSAATAGNDNAPIYVIRIDDILHISVWKEPELTTNLSVRPDGKISLPLINDVQAAGLTPMQLAGSLKEKLIRFVDDPRVTVAVAEMNRPKVYVTGEVLRHGPISLMPDMTVLQALSTSGLTPFANMKKIYVLRSSEVGEQKFSVNYKQLLRGQDMKQNIVLKPGDTIVVP